MSREHHDETQSSARRRFLKATGLAGLAATGLSGTALAQEGTTTTGGETEDAGLVTVEREGSVKAVTGSIQSAMEESDDVTLLTTVDHAKNAESVGKSLQPTRLLLFGNPNVGTPLMQRERTIGIDLPQRMLVWRDGDTTKVTYNDPAYLVDRHGIDVPDAMLQQIEAGLRALATAGN